jgi:hypothetical protein
VPLVLPDPGLPVPPRRRAARLVVDRHGGRPRRKARAAVRKSFATPEPNVVTDDGTWAIIDGTGAYEPCKWRGRVTWTADHTVDLIRRPYSGMVRRS